MRAFPPRATISATSVVISCFTCSEIAFPSISVIFNIIVLVIIYMALFAKIGQITNKEKLPLTSFEL